MTWLVSMLVACACLVPSMARADDNSALAERLFIEGRTLTESGKVEQACDKFAESYRLDAALGTLLNLAECQTVLGRTASAWAHFRELAEKARRAGQRDREDYAKQKLAELEPKLGFAHLEVPGDRPVERLDIDQQTLGPASYSTDLPLDPGKHLVTVVSQEARYELPFTLPDGPGHFVVHLALDDAHRVSPPTAARAGPPVSPAPRGADARVVIGITSLALSLVAAGVGSYLGVKAISLKNESDRDCTASSCNPTGLDRFGAARAHANGATAAFIVSGATLATGTGLLVWFATDKAPAASVSVVGRF